MGEKTSFGNLLCTWFFLMLARFLGGVFFSLLALGCFWCWALTVVYDMVAGIWLGLAWLSPGGGIWPYCMGKGFLLELVVV